MLSIKRVLISDKVDSSCKDILEKNGISVDYKPGTTKEELMAIIKVIQGFLHNLIREGRPP